jgi:hypothetical protein
LALRTGLGTAAEIQIGVNKNTCEIDDKNRIKEQFISSQVFYRTTGGRVQKITTEEQFESRILEYFDPVTQEYNRDEILQQYTHKNLKQNRNLRSRQNSLLVLPGSNSKEIRYWREQPAPSQKRLRLNQPGADENRILAFYTWIKRLLAGQGHATELATGTSPLDLALESGAKT